MSSPLLIALCLACSCAHAAAHQKLDSADSDAAIIKRADEELALMQAMEADSSSDDPSVRMAAAKHTLAPAVNIDALQDELDNVIKKGDAIMNTLKADDDELGNIQHAGENSDSAGTSDDARTEASTDDATTAESTDKKAADTSKETETSADDFGTEETSEETSTDDTATAAADTETETSTDDAGTEETSEETSTDETADETEAADSAANDNADVAPVDDGELNLVVEGKTMQTMYPHWSAIASMGDSQKKQDFLAVKDMAAGDERDKAIADLFHKYVVAPTGEDKLAIDRTTGHSSPCCGCDCGPLDANQDKTSGMCCSSPCTCS